MFPLEGENAHLAEAAAPLVRCGAMRTIVQLLVVLALGGGLVFYGVQQLNSDQVDCGGQRMSHGDVCTSTSNGKTTHRNIDQQRSQGRQGDYIGIGFGALILLVGGALVWGGARNRRQERAAQAQNALVQ
jgi:hypothetical protein